MTEIVLAGKTHFLQCKQTCGAHLQMVKRYVVYFRIAIFLHVNNVKQSLYTLRQSKVCSITLPGIGDFEAQRWQKTMPSVRQTCKWPGPLGIVCINENDRFYLNLMVTIKGNLQTNSARWRMSTLGDLGGRFKLMKHSSVQTDTFVSLYNKSYLVPPVSVSDKSPAQMKSVAACHL